MEAKDLMIGDWVQVDGKFYRYEFPTCNMNNELDGGLWISDSLGNRYFTGFEDIEPILLTQEILEKNGFENSSSERHFYLNPSYESHVNVFWNDNTVSIDIRTYFTKEKDKNGNYDIVDYDRRWTKDVYVHQLQQAFKMCGINKEIIL